MNRRSLDLSLALAAVLLAGCEARKEEPVHAGAVPNVLNPAPGRVRFAPESPELQRIRVGAVELRKFPTDEIVAPGKVETNPNRISRVVTPVAGRVLQVFVALGAAVQQGQPLIAVDSVDAGAAIAAYRQAEVQARAVASALNKTTSDLSRLKELYEHKAAALKDVQSAQNDVTQAQAGVDQAETARNEARHRLELLSLDSAAPSPVVTVRAPISGKVLEISVVQGEFRNDTNAPLMTIADLSTVWISADVPESAIRLIDPGEGVEVLLSAYPNQIFHARVMRIADVVDPQTRAVKVHSEIVNPDGKLRPEMFARIRHSHGAKEMPSVPAAALLESGGQTWVFAEKSPGEFERTAVRTGADSGGYVPLLSGLKPGDRVVVDGAILLQSQAGGQR
jgi:membrane fusion protein, heavy metal efflux system